MKYWFATERDSLPNSQYATTDGLDAERIYILCKGGFPSLKIIHHTHIYLPEADNGQ